MGRVLDIRMLRFSEIGLPAASNDRMVWHEAQQRQMLLLTGNRTMNEPDSLEQTIREENIPTALPVLTVGAIERIWENDYREACAERIAEIALDLELYRGTGRLFIP